MTYHTYFTTIARAGAQAKSWSIDRQLEIGPTIVNLVVTCRLLDARVPARHAEVGSCERLGRCVALLLLITATTGV